MTGEDIKKLTELLDERTMALMERESDLADRMEEIEAQKEELTAAVEELADQNKVLQTALRELKERNQELDQLLYRTSHDLRSPVASIIGIVNLLEQEIGDSHRQYLQHIYHQTTQMDGLLKSLASLSRTILNEIRFSRFNLDSCIRQCINDLKYMSNFSSVVIRTETSGMPEVVTDILLLSIVIKSLLANAITFQSDAGEGLVIIRSNATASSIFIEIVDNGEGITDAIKDKVFDMFYRGSSQSSGSGLGLYIVKKIVNQLNGQVSFTSKPGMTTFEVTVPNVVAE